MPRFVILTHDWPFPHWDFLLEWGSVLRSWRLLDEPESGREVPAELLPDHRLEYLDYEGPVSGERGSVSRWDAGTYRVVQDLPGDLRLVVTGEKIQGPVQVISDSASGCCAIF